MPDPSPPPRVTANVGMRIGNVRVQLEADAATGPVGDDDVLPFARALTAKTVELASRDVEKEGRAISCRAGCGACCRQLVPIAPVEARRLAALVEALPEPRRSVVRDRFADARRRLEAAGLLASLEEPPTAHDDRRALGLVYFRLGIACPFLDEESCSIHPERPLACREYLVTSPAANCKEPSAETVQMVPLAARVSNALGRMGRTSSSAPSYVPLVLAPSWAASHPAPPQRPGTDVLREFLGAVSGTGVPPASA